MGTPTPSVFEELALFPLRSWEDLQSWTLRIVTNLFTCNTHNIIRCKTQQCTACSMNSRYMTH